MTRGLYTIKLHGAFGIYIYVHIARLEDNSEQIQGLQKAG